MNISVVIPNWNGAKYLSKCIESLLAQDVKPQIIIVDNNSTDKSLEIIGQYPEVIILKQAKNLGFAGGVNVGIEHAINNKADYVALFNNDAEADKYWLSNLLYITNNNPKVGIVTCKFLKMDAKTIDSTGDFYTKYGLAFPRGRNEIDQGQYDHKTDIFAGSGGASLYKTKMLKEIGLFDNDFFAYFEDVDLSFRAQLAGWKVKYQPKAIAYHHISATTSKISGFASYHTAKNFPLLYLKNMPCWLLIKYLPLAFYWYFRMFAAKIIRGDFWAFAKGWFVSLLLTPKKIIERYKIQKNRTASTQYIDSILINQRPPKPPMILAK